MIDLASIGMAIKPKADSTLCNMKKADLIEYIRCLENNYNAAVWFNENQARYVESLNLPKWISCAERLPMYNERVLAYVCGRIEPLTLFYRDLHVEDYWEDDVQRVIILGAVTHWMPLPQPPKGDE